MALNTATVASGLADEVADLLGHDNQDRRILDWLTLTLNDLVVRIPSPLFYDTVDALAISANTRSTTLTSAVEIRLGSPVLCVFKAATGTIYTPKYRNPQDFDRLEKERQGSAPDTGLVPLFWTIGPVSGTAGGRLFLRYYPEVTQAYTATLFFTGVNEDDELTGTEYFRIPYHWEHVLVWGAAAFGAKLMRPSLAPLLMAEYEEAVNKLALLMNTRPDATPVLQSITGPYDGTPVLPQGARFPSNIG